MDDKSKDRDSTRLLRHLDRSNLSKSKNYMSTSAFQTLSKEVVIHQKALNKSLSAGDVKYQSRQDKIVNQKALYGTLPFFATFGMQHKESSVYELFANIRLRSYENIPKDTNDKTNGIHTENGEADEVIITLPLIIGIIMTVTLQFLCGYNLSIFNGTMGLVYPDNTIWDWTVIIVSFAIGAPFGSLLGGYCSNRYGRRFTLLLSTSIFLIASILSAFSTTVSWLIIGRVLTGIASGIAVILVPIYLGEVAPPILRGLLGTVVLFAQNFGMFTSILIVFPIQHGEDWRWIFGFNVLICLFLLCTSPFLLESPRWSLARDENSKAARVAIRQLRGFRLEEDVEHEVENFLYGASRHKTKRSSANSMEAMWDLLMDRDYQFLVIAVMFLQISRQWCGANILFFYSTCIYENLPLTYPLVYSLFLMVINLIAVYVALKLIPFSERRTLLLLSAGGMLLGLSLMTLVLKGKVSHLGLFIGSAISVIFYEIGLGPIPRLLVAEMFEAKYVSTAMTILSIVTWIGNIFTTLFFLFLQNYLQKNVFLPNIIVLALTFIIVYLYLPETYGKTVEEVQRILAMNPEGLLNVIVEAVEIEDFDDEKHRFAEEYDGR